MPPPSVDQPRFALDDSPTDGPPTDDKGNRWKDVAVDDDGRVLAGHTEDGKFRVYVPTERLYDHLCSVVNREATGRPTGR